MLVNSKKMLKEAKKNKKAVFQFNINNLELLITLSITLLELNNISISSTIKIYIIKIFLSHY